MQDLEALLLELNMVYFSLSDISNSDCVFFKEAVAILVGVWGHINMLTFLFWNR